MNDARQLAVEPLTAAAFAPFGEVVEAGTQSDLINQGTARQYADLARIDVAAEGGTARVSLYRAEERRWPLAISMLERHPLGSQLFMPLSRDPFLVVVAPAAAVPDREAVRAFLTNGRQGVNYRRGTWHHPLIALAPGEFLVLDRGGAGANCDEFHFRDGGFRLLYP
ncbi:MAG TPA: ureidoglycolate lyase [Steroidobacteraceae bacterium]|nr:ureidoglycolate lyase [Steroidobacteraceae bacterium]